MSDTQYRKRSDSRVVVILLCANLCVMVGLLVGKIIDGRVDAVTGNYEKQELASLREEVDALRKSSQSTPQPMGSALGAYPTADQIAAILTAMNDTPIIGGDRSNPVPFKSGTQNRTSPSSQEAYNHPQSITTSSFGYSDNNSGNDSSQETDTSNQTTTEQKVSDYIARQQPVATVENVVNNDGQTVVVVQSLANMLADGDRLIIVRNTGGSNYNLIAEAVVGQVGDDGTRSAVIAVEGSEELINDVEAGDVCYMK